ncbi:MAG: WD40 repeat domain-containing protein [bacterium]|nr:WD40 repeat domain-containing protein [bacterium]
MLKRHIVWVLGVVLMGVVSTAAQSAQYEIVERVGFGVVNDIQWLGDNETLAVTTPRGIYLYRESEPLWLYQDRAEQSIIITTSRNGNPTPLPFGIYEPPVIAFAPDASVYAVAEHTGDIVIRNTSNDRSPQVLRTDDDLSTPYKALVFTHDSSTLIAARSPLESSNEAFIEMWDVGTGELLRTLRLERVLSPRDLALSPDGQFLAVNGAEVGLDYFNGMTYVIALETGAVVARANWFTPEVSLPDVDAPSVLAYNQDDGSALRFVREESPFTLRSVEDITTVINAPPADAPYYMVVEGDAVRVYASDNQRQVVTLPTADNVQQATLSSDGVFLAIHFDDGTIQIFQVDEPHLNEVRTISGYASSDALSLEMFSHTTAIIASDGTEIEGMRLAGDSWDVTAPIFTEQAPIMLTHQSDNTVYLLELPDESSDTQVRVLNFSPDGRWLAVGVGEDALGGASDNFVYLWDLRTMEESRRPLIALEHNDMITQIAFNPASNILVTADEYSHAAYVWSIQPWALQDTLLYPAQVIRITFDDRMVITYCNDGVTRYWRR